jgi:hypothetical protein
MNCTSTEYYGGTALYNADEKLVTWIRYAGFFSNVTVMMHYLCDLKLQGHYPDKISTWLTEYKNLNIYDGIFYIDKNKIEDWKTLDAERVRRFRHGTGVNLYGFGTSKVQIDIGVVKCLMSAYFNVASNVLTRATELQQGASIDVSADTFTWWRKTDKVNEITWYRHDAKYPSVEQLWGIIGQDSRVHLQTDDIDVYNYFEDKHNVCRLNILPIGHDKKSGFHVETKDISPEKFTEIYGKDFYEYTTNLVALTVVASRCLKFVGYPGNISMFVCLLRGGFDNVVFFKDDRDFF